MSSFQKIVPNPDSTPYKLIDNLKHLSNQQSKYSVYDNKAPKFIEPFFSFNNNFMLEKLLIILIISILAIFIMLSMEFI